MTYPLRGHSRVLERKIRPARILLVDALAVSARLGLNLLVSFDQGEFDFNAETSEEGFHNWRRELDERKRAFELRFGVILGRPVRVTLTNHRIPLEGIIRLASEERNMEVKHLRFRLNGVEFSIHDMESIVRIGRSVD